MTRRRSLTRRLFLAGAAASTLPACGGPARPRGLDLDDGEMTWFASSITQNQNDPRRVLVDAFERLHVDIKVREITGNSITDTMRETLRRNIQEGRSFPDVYLGDVIWPADFAHNHLAARLDDRFPRDFWARFDPDLVKAARVDGKIYAAPFYADQGMLFYRSDLVHRAPDTWEELAKSAQDLRRQGKVDHGLLWQGAAYEGLTCCWTEFAADGGVLPPEPDGGGGDLDSDAAREVLGFLRGLITDKVSPDTVTSAQEKQALGTFTEGRTAYMRGWNSAWVSINTPEISRVAGKVGVAPLPTFAGHPKRYSSVGGWSLYVNPHTKAFADARTFVDWMTDADAQNVMARYSTLPTNAAVRREPDLLASSAPLAAAVGATPIARPAGTPNYRDVSQAIYTNINRALRGEVPPAVALAAAERGVRAAFRASS